MTFRETVVSLSMNAENEIIGENSGKSRVIFGLLQLWIKHPHQRLGQLIKNILVKRFNTVKDLELSDLFFIPDSDLLEVIIKIEKEGF